MIRSRLSNDSSRNTGMMGEKLAAGFLKKKGFKIIKRNFNCKFGEIDLIATKDEYLVFVEVKSRIEKGQRISPLISVTQAKQNKLRLLGRYFLQISNLKDRQPRFDVIGVTFRKDNQCDFEHIENAF